MNFSLDSLRCFEAAATWLNFRVAATKVALSPTAFSERIKRLEEDLGKKLFERNTRHVALTLDGLKLLPHARQLLRDAQRCAEVVSKGSDRAPFTLRLGTRFELGMSWVAPAIAPLKKERPEQKLDLSFGDGPALLAQLKRGQIDAMISSVRLVDPRLRYVVLHEERYAFVASPKLLRRRRLVGPADAAHHTLLDIRDDLPLFRYFLDSYSGDKLFGFADIEHLGTIAAVRLRLLDAAGVAVLPRYFVAADIIAKRLAVLFPRIPLAKEYFRLVWSNEHPLQDKLRALAERMRKMPLK